MAINKNHEFEELDGIKCAIVERSVSEDRVQFLKDLLEFNRYTVVVVPTPLKAPVPSTVEGVETIAQPPSTFTIGVTDTTFNPINAIFGRLLKTPNGHIVTLAYWEQKDTESHDDIPYFDQQ